MSGVRRYRLRTGGKHARLLFLLAMLLLALLAGGAVLAVKRRPAVLPPELERPESTVLLDRSEAEIRRIGIQSPYDAPYALVPTEEGWTVEGETGRTYRQAMLEAIVLNAAYLLSEETVLDLKEEPGLTFADFGLDENAVQVTVAYADGTQAGFAIGDAVTFLPGGTPAFYYACLAGESVIHTVSADVWEAFTNSRMSLRAVADPALNGSLIDRIAFSGEAPMTLEKRSDGWYLTEPWVYPLDSSAVERLLKEIEGVRFAQLVGVAEELDLADYALDAPRRTLTLDIAESIVTGYDENDSVMGEARLPAYQLVFDIGREDSDVVFYCNYRGNVVKVTRFSADFMLTQGYEELLLTAPANAPTNDLVRMRWQSTVLTREYTFELVEQIDRNNAFVRDAQGNILYDLHVARAGEAVEEAAFLQTYRAFLGLRTPRRLPAGYQPSGEPRLTVTLERSDSTRTLAFYPYDALHEAVAVDGIALFYTEAGWDAALLWP